MAKLRAITKIRLFVLGFSFALSIVILMGTIGSTSEQRLQIIRLTELYALTAITYLYFTLLATPLIRIFPRLPYAGKYIQARRALGLSVLYFALLHASLTFFGELGGFPGLMFLSSKYLLAISLGATALFIFSVMAIISWDGAIRRLGFMKWKCTHRFIYLAAVLVLIHALMLGSHFANLSDTIPQILFIAVSILLFLEALRFDSYLQKRYHISYHVGLTTLLITSVIIALQILQLLPTNAPSLSIHQQHLLLARDLQQGTNSQTRSTIPGLLGDPTKRYTVDIDSPDVIAPGDEVTLRFHIFDSQNGNPVTFFQENYTKLMHLVIIANDFSNFSHLHPTQENNTFTITTTFPKDGIYHLYLTYQPFGSIEQQAAFTIPVGTGETQTLSPANTALTKKIVGKYIISLSYTKPLIASKLTLGEQTLTFTIQSAENKKPITTLEPYLGAFGHLVMVNEKTYDYLHVHPAALRGPLPGEKGGPTVDFVPLGLTAPIRPGMYQLFAQFNLSGTIQTVTFAVNVE